MRVNREKFLKALESVAPGLASKENIEQSSSFAFRDGRVHTFNDEVSCSRAIALNNVEGAVKAKPMLDILSRLDEDIDIIPKAGELVILGKKKKIELRLDSEIFLPIDAVEAAEEWSPLDAQFTEGVGIVEACASREQAQFVFTCVHITPDFVESCDKFQIARYGVETGFDHDVLVRAESLKGIIGLGMNEVSETDSWIHFRNPDGLVFSCRKYEDEYHDIGKFLTDEDTEPMTMPGGITEVLQRASVFSEDNIGGNLVTVELKEGAVTIKGEGASGRYLEQKAITYSGERVRFMIAPKLLAEVTRKSNECRVGKSKLFIDGGKYQYATSTMPPERKGAKPTKKTKKKKTEDDPEYPGPKYEGQDEVPF